MPYHTFKCSECIPERKKHAVVKGEDERFDIMSSSRLP